MIEDPLEIVITVPMKETTPEEAPKDTPVTAVTDPEEAPPLRPRMAELFNRGDSVPLAVEDVEEEVKEVEAPAKTVEELKIRFHRTPMGASGDIRGKYEYEIVRIQCRMYPNNYNHD